MRTHLIMTPCTTFVSACIIHDGPGSKAGKVAKKERGERKERTRKINHEKKKKNHEEERFINSRIPLLSRTNILFATHK